MQQNEIFILGMTHEDIQIAIENNDYRQISEHLYRVQKISTLNYVFRHHLETQIIDDDNSKKSKRFINVRSIGTLFSLNPLKVKIDCLGNIKSISL
jgi:CRISPR-associated endonuclease Csn1